jgi:hypothetical protein
MELFVKIIASNRPFFSATLLLRACVAGVLCVVCCATHALHATTYYISSVHGNNNNKGTSDKEPWHDFKIVNGRAMSPGDRILLERGSIWNDTILSPKGSGTQDQPIVIASYGSSTARPVINANGYQSSLNGMTSAVIGDTANYPNYRYGSGAVTLFNQQYWEIYDLELTNHLAGTLDPTDRANNFSGIRVWARSAGKLSHIYIRGNYVHDVTGLVSWSGDRAESKRTGGIVVYTWDYNSDHAGTRFDDVRVEKNFLVNVGMEGIAVQQAVKTNAFGLRKQYGDHSTYIPFTHVIVSGNLVDNMNNMKSTTGIQLVGVEDGHVFNNLVLGGGCVGIETDGNNGTVVELNEVSGVHQHYINGGGIDHAGIDTDIQSSNVVVQYNYVHDNGEGIIVDSFGWGFNNAVRYNLVVNNNIGPEGKGDSLIPGDQVRVAAENGTTYVYGNTIYSTSHDLPIMGFNQPKTSGDIATYYIEDNVFDGGSAAWPGGSAMVVHFNANDYFGNGKPPAGANALLTDPQLLSPGETNYSLKAGIWPTSVQLYRMTAGSPLRNAGAAPQQPSPPAAKQGTRDMFGGQPSGAISIGADFTGVASQGAGVAASGTKTSGGLSQ